MSHTGNADLRIYDNAVPLPPLLKEEGACRDTAGSVDFVADSHVGQREAAKFCRDWCPEHVRAACLAYALEAREYGTWGATTELGRANIRMGRATSEDLDAPAHRRKLPETCLNGHNDWAYAGQKQQQRYCRTCSTARQRARREKRAGAGS